MKRFFTFSLFLAFCGGLIAQTPCENGIAGGYPCDNIDLWSFTPLEDLDAIQNLNDIWGWTDIVSGREFAIVGMRNGTSFVEVTDPANPIYLGFLDTHTVSSLWRDIKVYDDHAFIVSEASGHGMQVFDLTQLLTITDPPLDFEETAFYGEFGNAHNIAINEETGYAYAVGTGTFNGGLHIIDIQDPVNPVIAGDFAEDGYTHDAQIVIYNGPDPDYQGKEIAFNCNEDRFTIADVDDKTDTQLISANPYEDTGYCHQGWLTEDHRYFLLNDELDELNGITTNTRTFVWDVRDLDNPVLVDVHEGVATSIDHNLYIHWQMVFQSNYRSGLRVLNVAKTSAPALNEIGFFDVQPSNDDPNFSGTWSNYCYFPSGNVVVTDMYTGLFVLRPRVATADYLVERVCFEDTKTVNAYISYPAEESSVTVSGLPSGVTAEVQDYNLPGEIPIVLEGLSGLAPGEYPYTYTVSYDGQSYELEGLISIDDIELPVIDNLSPSAGTLDPAGITLEWDSNLSDGEYVIEVASDDGFESIVFTETTMENSITIPFDLPDGDYYWQIVGNGSADCEEDIQSETETFNVLFIGIEGVDYDGVSLFPNPTSGELQITAREGVDHIYIFAADGKRVAEFTLLNGRQLNLDISDFAKGVYVVSDNLGNKTRIVLQ